MRLVSMIQQNITNQGNVNQGQINIQDNAFQQENVQVDKAREARRRNFFEKKRFINYPYSNPAEEGEDSDNGAN